MDHLDAIGRRIRATAFAILPVALASAVGCGGETSSSLKNAAVASPKRALKSRTLRATVFTTIVPDGWRERHLQGKGDDVYFFGSGSKAPNELGIVPGAIGITIGTQPATQAHDPASAAIAIKGTVGTPNGAAHVTLTEPITKAQLGGADAATSQFTYAFRGAKNVQSDLVALHGSKLVVIEVNSGPSLEPTASRVVGELIKAWRWRQPDSRGAKGATAYRDPAVPAS